MTETKPYFDVILVVPLPEEFDACLEQFTIEAEHSAEGFLRLEARVDETAFRVLLIEQRDMGKAEAFRAARQALEDFDTSLLACAGIAAGLSKDVNIGDVCYTGITLDITENTKVSDKESARRYAFSPIPSETPKDLAAQVRLNRVLPTSKPGFERWQAESYDRAKAAIPGEFNGKGGKLEVITRPKALPGYIACGMVSADPEYNHAIRLSERRVLALETESAGLFEAAAGTRIPVINFRGISDYAGSDKTLFEAQTDNQARRIAADNVMRFVRDQLLSTGLRKYLARVRAGESEKQPDLLPALENDEQKFARLLSQRRDAVEAGLRDLVPRYESQKPGYRLPIPRILVDRSDAAGARTRTANDLNATLSENRLVTVRIPPGYPDKSLAWAIAADLIGVEKDGRQLLPYVVRPSDLQRPRKGVASVLGEEDQWMVERDYTRLVYVIDSFNFESTSRPDFLAEEMSTTDDALFIVLSQSTSNAIAESGFHDRTGALDARLEQVPFSAISQFCKANFEMSSRAAEVVAARMYSTFRKFRLAAHPAYFAGVSREALGSILDANRRADLIELAVSGYLTLAVSGDKEKVRLSRRARERFLTELAFEINVEKRSFGEADLVLRAERLAEEMDYSIRPAGFVSWFFDHHILHCEDHGVEFTLPFMESFLLARRLSEMPGPAEAYFDVDREDFDYSTFMLYAELGASDAVIEKVMLLIDSARDALAARSEKLLVRNEIRPAFLYRQKEVRKLRDDLARVKEDVRLDRDRSNEKQRILDASERVQESAAVRNAETTDKAARDPIVIEALRAFNIGASLLGAGAESLNADRKRRIASSIVQLTAFAIDDWTRASLSLDFPSMKREVLQSSEIRSMLDEQGPEARELSERVLDLVLDTSEFVAQSQPFISMTSRLCAEAHDVVLAESLTHIPQEEALAEMVRALWLVALDAERGRTALEGAIRGMKNAVLARVALSQALRVRVVWQTPTRRNQEIMLDLADSALEVISAKVDRPSPAELIDKPAEA